MANREHLSQLFNQLRSGPEAWNNWRKENSGVELDFSGYKFEGMLHQNLFKLDFSSANLVNADFSGCNLSGANLSSSRLWNANLSRASLDYSNINGAELCNADLRNATLINTSLVEADLSFARLTHAILDTARLSGATLYEARADRASFRNADLEGVRFVHTVLSYTDMTGANLYGAVLSNTVFGETGLDEVTGLDSCTHVGPSVLDYGTLEISKGLPLAFLRGCGLPDSLIAYIPSLTSDALQFYKCFISFTEADDAFSERLYYDLQAKGVRCWRWKEDAKWGKSLMHSIDEAVHYYDKLIVICSEQSLSSPAVIREIERALQKEDDLARQGKEGEVLFPIRLDDYIFTGWNHHRKADVVAKTVGDFRGWKEHASYQQALNRLLRDLKAESQEEMR